MCRQGGGAGTQDSSDAHNNTSKRPASGCTGVLQASFVCDPSPVMDPGHTVIHTR